MVLEEFQVDPVASFPCLMAWAVESETENWGTLCCPPHPHQLAASLAPRAGRVHSWSSVVRVLIRRLLLPGLWGRGLGHWSRQTAREYTGTPSRPTEGHPSGASHVSAP